MTRQPAQAPDRAPRGVVSGDILAGLALGALCLVAYSNSWRAAFTFDDFSNIVRNPWLRWTELSFANLAATWHAAPSPRPVASASFGLNHYFGGYDVRGYHAVNTAIHWINGVLVYALALVTLRRAPELAGSADRAAARLRWAAWFGAAVFVAHPIQTQSVTYIVQRMTSLATCFYLAALLLAVHALRVGGQRAGLARWLALAALGSWLLALGSKEIAVVLPAALWLYYGCFFRDLDRAWIRRTPVLGAVFALGVVLGIGAATGGAPLDGYARRDFTLAERLLTQLRVVVHYLSLILWPSPSRLNLFYDFPLSRSLFAPMSTFFSLGALIALLAVAVRVARRERVICFAILWFFLHLALESSFLPLELVYEHRTYLPMVGVALLAARAASAAAAIAPRVALPVGAALIAALALGTYLRNEVWHDSIRLWTDIAAKSPAQPRSHANLGIAVASVGRHAEALAHYREALRLDAGYVEALRNTGASLVALGRVAEAVPFFREAVRLDPQDPVARGGLGVSLVRTGAVEEAVTHLEASLRRMPDARFLAGLGDARTAQGRDAEAVRAYEAAARLNPHYWQPRAALAEALLRVGRIDEARRAFESAALAAARAGAANDATALRKRLEALAEPR